MQISWFIPTTGDGRYLSTSKGTRPTDLRYLRQIAQAADQLGYYSVLLPTGNSCEDSWVIASALMPATERLRFLVAIRPGIMSPVVAARMASTFDRMSSGRLLINVVTGGDPKEAAAEGVFLPHDERYAVTSEFLEIWRDVMAGGSSSFEGKYLHVEGAKVYYPALQTPYPPLYFGGSSDAGIDLAAKQVDVYLTWGEPPYLVAEKIKRVREAAAKQGRTLRFGIRLHVIVRETNDEAWRAANELIQYVDRDVVTKAQQGLAKFDSEGQRRMAEIVKNSPETLEVSPGLWTGIGLVRSGAGTALVGDAETVAQRILEYADLGIDSFIFSGYPHLEEAYRVKELLFPLLPIKHGDPVAAGEHRSEEFIGNEFRPITVRKS
jgi:alkanesulfonate monooxygenase